MRTSVSDRAPYLDVCREAVESEEAFAHFKRQRGYQHVLEHPRLTMGWIYLASLVQDHPFLVYFLDRFRINDILGDPVTFNYGYYGRFSPTTLRYAVTLGQLVDTFDVLSDMDVIEIGAGYGGQCLIIDQYCRFRSYTIIDLPPCLELARKYLRLHDVPDVRYWRPEDVPVRPDTFDLVISNFSFSECVREIQDFYLDRILKHSAHGYLVCNNVDPTLRGYSLRELQEQLPHATFGNEYPLTRKGNYRVTWRI